MRLIKDTEIKKVLKLLCPGTALRDGLENILRAQTGGLLVLGDNEEIMKLVDGGFRIDTDYTSEYIYELAKMDGAIVISSDLKKIVCANVQLQPNPAIQTFETGTRHRTAHRVSKQTGNIVIAISQRRRIITVYKGDLKYVLKDSSVILSKASQAVSTLEKYVTVLERIINNLNLLEFQNSACLLDVSTAIQRTEMIMRMVEEINIYILELGNEGRLISMQLNELIWHIERDGMLLLKDYISEGLDVEEIYKSIQKLSQNELLNLDLIAREIGYGGSPLIDTFLYPKGYRMLSKIQRIPTSVIENLVCHFNDFSEIIDADIDDLDMVEGIGEARATAIKSGLKRIKEQSALRREI